MRGGGAPATHPQHRSRAQMRPPRGPRWRPDNASSLAHQRSWRRRLLRAWQAGGRQAQPGRTLRHMLGTWLGISRVAKSDLARARRTQREHELVLVASRGCAGSASKVPYWAMVLCTLLAGKGLNTLRLASQVCHHLRHQDAWSCRTADAAIVHLQHQYLQVLLCKLSRFNNDITRMTPLLMPCGKRGLTLFH